MLAIIISSIAIAWLMSEEFMFTIHAICFPIYLFWEGIMVPFRGTTSLSYLELMMIIFMAIGMSQIITIIIKEFFEVV